MFQGAAGTTGGGQGRRLSQGEGGVHLCTPFSKHVWHNSSPSLYLSDQEDSASNR